MARLYDHYFSVHDYQQRYPEPNASTLAFLLRHGAGKPGHVLDFGCGNGRYALALLEKPGVHVTGYDISAAALAEFQFRVSQQGFAERSRLIHGTLADLHGSAIYDTILILFGVLSHTGDRRARLQTLRHLRGLIRPDGRLIVSVPCKWRRRPLEAISAFMRRATGRAEGMLREPGNITFARRLGGVPHEFFYHLYSVRELVEELAEAGFAVQEHEPESVLPEWFVTQHYRLGQLDAWAVKALPTFLGYGIRVCAVPC